MSSLSDMPELEDATDGGFAADDVAVDLSGAGINLNELRESKETTFEIDPNVVNSNMMNTSDKDYFDKEEIFKQLNFDCIDNGDETGDDRGTPFERLKYEMKDLTGDDGVLKKIIKHGAGSVVPMQSLCRVHYNAYLEYSDEPFDSSRLRGKQHQFKLGCGEALKGWEVGVATMKRGELSRFIIDHRYAYGNMGCPPRIPAKAMVLFEIELISFVDQGASDEFENFSEEERKKASFKEILQVVDSLRLTGNEAFQLNQIGRSAGKYSQALRLLENANLKDEVEEKLMKTSALKLYLNMSLCDMKQARYGRSCKYARKALDIDYRNVKALFRLARALRMLGNFHDAKKHISKAHRLDPGNDEVMDELRKLDDEMKKSRLVDKDLCQKMLQLGNHSKSEAEAQPQELSQMVQMLQQRLKGFLKEEDSKEFVVPNILTDGELVSLERVAKEMNLHVYIKRDGSQKSVLILKSPYEEQPNR